MNRLMFTTLAAMLLAACSTTPEVPVEPEFNAPVLNVSLEESSNYWTLDRRSQVDARRLIGEPATALACRRAVLAYTVDSNGRVFDVEVLDAWPNEAAARYFVAMRQHFRYEATPANTDRTPIRTVGTNTAMRRGADCEFPSMKGLSWPDDEVP